MRLPRALSRLRGTTVPAAPIASWRSDDAITSVALRAGAQEHEVDAVLVQVRGTAPVPVPPEVTEEVRAALENVRAGGPVRYGTGLFGWGRVVDAP